MGRKTGGQIECRKWADRLGTGAGDKRWQLGGLQSLLFTYQG